jgi:hypothetical protein
MASMPFGDEPPKHRFQRALVYFGLKADPTAPDDSSSPTDEETPPAADPPGERRDWQHKALVYFGLVDEEASSRYGAGISAALDSEIDELTRRITALEAEVRRYRAGERID